MLFKNITILDSNLEVKNNMYVGIKDKKIVYISNEMPKEDFGEVYNGEGKLLMPGFYNTHAHSAMTLMRGYGENYALSDWLNKKIFPFENHLNDRAVYYGTLIAMAESFRFGIVSTSDMYFYIDAMYEAVKDSKAKNNLARAISQFDESDTKELPSYIETERVFKSYHNSLDEKVKIDTSLHAEYTIKPWTAEAMAAFSKENNSIMQIHISETKSEHEECIKKYGLTPVQFFNKYGALDPKTVLAHCVWITDEDIEILKTKDTTIASNPISNLKLASGVCNVPKLLKNGIKVGIGTDSVASNNSLNFIEEMKIFAMASKMMFNDPTAVTPKETIYSATRVGALAQGREDCGLLKEGYRADLIVLDINQPHMTPVYDLLNNIVYSASGSDIVLTMVDGEVVYKDGEYLTIDIEKAMREIDVERKGILSKI